jgi:hypothetical protein
MRQKPLRMQRDVRVPASHCTNCNALLDGGTAVTESISKRTRKLMPDPGDFTVCCYCGHLLVYADNLMVRDPTSEELDFIAGDRRVLAIQKALSATKK